MHGKFNCIIVNFEKTHHDTDFINLNFIISTISFTFQACAKVLFKTIPYFIIAITLNLPQITNPSHLAIILIKDLKDKKL